MARVEAWYSTQQSVYHVCTARPKGRDMEAEHRRLGKGDRPPCQTCLTLIRGLAC